MVAKAFKMLMKLEADLVVIGTPLKMTFIFFDKNKEY
jgi:hypothetical protein